MPKYAYITSISPGYMFSLNCNFNTNKFYDTNADYLILYDHWMVEEEQTNNYMKRCEDKFPFKIKWFKMEDYANSFHSSKYALAATITDEYDSICLIDSDLFICTDTREYFERAARENVLITAEHVWSQMNKDQMLWDDPSKCIDRNYCHIADFPVFVNPKFGRKMFIDWKFGTEDGEYGAEWQHPLIAFNRSVATNMKKEQLIVLPGQLWVCDNNCWHVDYEVGLHENAKICLTTTYYEGKKTPVGAIHNKWWKHGRCNGEFRSFRHLLNLPGIPEQLDKGTKNFNIIKDFMSKFNDMTPETKREDFLNTKIDWREYLATWTKE